MATYEDTASSTLGMDDTFVVVADILEGLGVGETAAYSFAEAIAELIEFNETTEGGGVLFGVVEEQLGAGEGTETYAVIFASVSDTAGIGDTMETIAQAFGAIIDQLGFSIVQVGQEVYLAVVMNTKHFGVTEYSLGDVSSMTTMDGHLLMTTDEGVFVLDGADDDGANIQGLIEGPLTNFDSPLKQRLVRMYLTMRNDAPMVASVLARLKDGTGLLKAMYKVDATSNELTTQRVVTGKGIDANFFQYQLQNLEGGAFELMAIEAVTENLSRRR